MNRLRLRTYVVIFGTSTPAGKRFDLLLIYLIIASVIAIALDTVQAVQDSVGKAFFIAELVFTALFTIEYCVRVWCHPHPWRYIRSFYGIVDLLSILPTYFSFFIVNANYLVVIRILRVLRIFRILKLMRYLSEANILMRSLWLSRRKIFIFFSLVMAITTIFGSLMYIIEGPVHGFTSIPKSIYWAIVTVTTVGYGDISPQTVLGQTIASLAMILGYSIIAVPTGIITAELASELQRDKATKACRNCKRTGHDSDAIHCKFCGADLFAEKSASRSS